MAPASVIVRGAADDDEGGHIHLVGGEIVEPADPFGLLRPSSMSDIGAQYVASALFPENVERFREQMPPFAPGGIVERHRQGRLRHSPEILPYFVRRDKQIGKAHQ